MSNTVMKITKLNISGNVIPNSWWKAITFDSGKPDSTAVVLLSEIIYWYRAAERLCELTGEVIGYEKRFKADKLQRSYQSFADKFGFTKRQVTDAMKRLQSKGLVTLEFRTLNVNGLKLTNVLYIEPVAEMIEKITFPESITCDDEGGDLSRSNVGGSALERDNLLRSNVTGSAIERDTNTKITTKITTKNTQEITQRKKSARDAHASDFREAEQIVFERWVEVHNKQRAKLTEQRRKKIRARLREGYSLEQILKAIDGVKLSPFHMGKNDSNTVYDDLTTILRDGTQVEKFSQLRDNPHAQAITNGEYSAVTARNIQNIQDWMKEQGDGNGPF